jgi:hypothetical protein
MTSIFGGGGGGSTTVVQAPTPLPPPTMPDPGSPANVAAGQQQAVMNATRAGRMSTILSTAASRGPSTIAGGTLGASKPSGQGAGGAAPSYTSVSL